jgi:selenide,water dikinase
MTAPVADPGPVHCGGCGAKLPAAVLREVLAELAREHPSVVASADLQEDAAIMPWPGDARLVQSVDSLRSLVDDPWQMGRIAALHALSDLYAMGAAPHSAQVQLCLPYAAPALQRRELYQLMSGLLKELQAAGAILVGGHSMEGSELTVGVTVNGALIGESLVTRGAVSGQRLVLSKPLGVGVVFAGAMTGRSPADTVGGAIESMLRSNREAAALARQFGASACTDVTGFGLLGHLLEMLPAHGVQAVLYRDRIPVLPGARELSASGVRSTLYPGNLSSLSGNLVDLAEEEPLLCDPQTSGGLLLALAPGASEALVEALRARGHGAAVIGELRDRDSGAALRFAE